MNVIYLLHYALSIVILTRTHNLFIFLGYFLFSIITFFLILYSKRQFHYHKLLYWTCTAIIAFTSVFIYVQRYQPQIIANTFHQQVYQASGTVSSIYGYGRYVFHDQYDAHYLLYTDQELQVGQQLFVSAYFHPAYTGFSREQRPPTSLATFNFPKRLLMKGFAGALYNPQFVTVGQESISFIQSTRQLLLSRIRSIFSPQTAGLTAGLLIGDRSILPDADYDMFIDSGLVHIIAVSGGNVVMLVIFLSAILFRLPFYLRTGIILLAIVAYGLLCGLESSVLRAVIMGSLSLLALFRGRQTHVRRSLVIAFIFMTLLNPYVMLYDIGFIFSFAAVIGIVYVSQRYQTRTQHSIPAVHKSVSHKLSKAFHQLLASYLIPTLGATLGVLPFLLFFTKSYNITSILANIIVIPFIPIVMISGFVDIVLYPLLQRPRLIYIQDLFIHYIYGVAERTARRGVYVQLHNEYFAYLRVIAILAWFIRDQKHSIRR